MAVTVPFLWDRLIGATFTSVMGGNVLLVGLVTIFFFEAFALALRLTWEINLLMLFFLTFLILSATITWITVVVWLTSGILLGIFLFNLIFRG